MWNKMQKHKSALADKLLILTSERKRMDAVNPDGITRETKAGQFIDWLLCF
jgi:hypothetical protein